MSSSVEIRSVRMYIGLSGPMGEIGSIAEPGSVRYHFHRGAVFRAVNRALLAGLMGVVLAACSGPGKSGSAFIDGAVGSDEEAGIDAESTFVSDAISETEASTDADVKSDDAGKEDTEPSSVCGNGVIENGEECDDGNVQDGDGCGWNCMLTVYPYVYRLEEFCFGRGLDGCLMLDVSSWPCEEYTVDLRLSLDTGNLPSSNNGRSSLRLGDTCEDWEQCVRKGVEIVFTGDLDSSVDPGMKFELGWKVEISNATIEYCHNCYTSEGLEEVIWLVGSVNNMNFIIDIENKLENYIEVKNMEDEIVCDIQRSL